MTLTITLPAELEETLRRRAAAVGKDVASFVRETVEEKLAPYAAPTASPDERAAAWDAWVAHMRDWAARNLPPGHVVDDSRESIYEGRGE